MEAAFPGQIPLYLPTAAPCLLALARAYSPHPLIKTVTAAAAAAAKAGAEATPSLPPFPQSVTQCSPAHVLGNAICSAPSDACGEYLKAAVSNYSDAPAAVTFNRN